MTPPFSIVKRKGSNNFQLRYYVPQEFRPALGGKQEIWRSLGTPKQSEAKERASEVANEIWQKILASQPTASVAATVQPEEPSHMEIEDAARQVYEIEVENDQEERADPEYMAQLESIGALDAKAWKGEAKRLRKAVGAGDLGIADHNYWSEHFGFHFQRNSPKERLFRQYLARAYAEAAKRFSEHAQGNFSGKPSDRLFRASVALSSAVPASSSSTPAPAESFKQPPLLEHWVMYVRQRGTGIKDDTITNRRRVVEMFAQFVGERRPADSITKDECREFRDLLYELPKKASTRREFVGMNLREIIQANQKHQFDTLTPSRIKHYISDLSGFFGWLATEGRVEGNYWQGLAPKVETKRRIPFSPEHLQSFFNSPLFTGCASDGNISKVSAPGDVLIRDWRFWMPLIAAFSGARLGEIAQLELSDVKSINDIECFEITNEGHDRAKSVKSGAAMRVVPIHSRLIELGLLKFVQEQRRAGQIKLFPELVRNRKGQFGKPSKFYQRYLERLNLARDSEGNAPTFHSFRHTVIDAFRRADLSEYEVQPIVGHEQKSVTRGYGQEATYSAKRRKQIIEKISYPGLDLSGVRYATSDKRG